MDSHVDHLLFTTDQFAGCGIGHLGHWALATAEFFLVHLFSHCIANVNLLRDAVTDQVVTRIFRATLPVFVGLITTWWVVNLFSTKCEFYIDQTFSRIVHDDLSLIP